MTFNRFKIFIKNKKNFNSLSISLINRKIIVAKPFLKTLINIINNVTAKSETQPDKIKELLVEQICSYGGKVLLIFWNNKFC